MVSLDLDLPTPSSLHAQFRSLRKRFSRSSERVQPDVVVSDIGMPREDGYALVRELRARGHRVPAVAFTAYGRSQDRERAFSAGFQVHVAKPADPLELAAVILALLGKTT
jgi:CheY-like chemotaxis protein